MKYLHYQARLHPRDIRPPGVFAREFQEEYIYAYDLPNGNCGLGSYKSEARVSTRGFTARAQHYPTRTSGSPHAARRSLMTLGVVHFRSLYRDPDGLSKRLCARDRWLVSNLRHIFTPLPHILLNAIKNVTHKTSRCRARPCMYTSRTLRKYVMDETTRHVTGANPSPPPISARTLSTPS